MTLRRHQALISLSVLSLALAAGCPCWAVAKEKTPAAKTETVKKTSAKSDTKSKTGKTTDKAETEVKVSAKSKTAKTKTVVASDDDQAPVSKKNSKSGKSTKLASTDSDTSAKKGADKKASAKKPNSKKGKPDASDDDDGDTKVLASNVTQKSDHKTDKASTKSDAKKSDDKSNTKLADAKKTGKTSLKLALAKPAVAVPAEKPVAAPVIVPVVMNAAPVPYRLMANTAPKPAQIALNTVLSGDDVNHYQAAYALIDQGDFEGADAELALTLDKSLMGYATFHKLFALGYESTYDELIDWMNHYGDQPMAMRVWGLAKRKKPDGAPDPAFPLLAGNPQQLAQATSGNAVQLSSITTLSGSTGSDADNGYATMPMLDPDSDLTPKSARSAYNNGQLEQAVTLGRKIGDHWVAGLASWRLQRYEQALAEFKFVSTDPSRNAWSQSGGAYWAARAALKMGRQDEAQTYLKIAASFPFTFYGLLAEARLGVTPAVVLSKKGLPPTFGNEQRTALTASLNDDFSWAKGSIQARRLNALVQIGRSTDAQNEMQAAVQRTSNGIERDRWLSLAAKMQVSVTQLQPNDRLFNPNIYPVPDFEPTDGFSVDRALIYAFARKESKFDPKAKSYSGAYGLLQLMPATAALVEDDPSFTRKPDKLLKASTNLRVGQKYIQRLFDSKIVSNDLLRTIAAYNAGPRPVKDAVDSLGPNADSLLVMESIPVAQTRQYVEEVAANYWIYRQILDNSSKTLAMAANDATIIDATADSEDETATN